MGPEGEPLGLLGARVPDAEQGTAGAVDGSGRPTNSGLSNFAQGKHLGLPNARKALSKVVSLYTGIDTAEWSFKLDASRLVAMASVLDQLVGQGEIDDDGRRFVVSRVGLPYRYKLAIADGFDLYLPAPDHSEIPLRVHAGARVCLMLGDELEAQVLEVLEWWVACSPDELRAGLCLSRVDTCQDLLMMEQAFNHMSRLVASNSNAVVTRGRYRQAFPTGTGYTGFAIGKNEVRLRLYNKGVKAAQDGTGEMWSEVWGQGEAYEVPEGYIVARVEYQFRRGFLGECCFHHGGHPEGEPCLGLRTLADYKRRAPMVLEYACTEWFKLAGPSQGKDHERPLLPIWRNIRDGFVNLHWSQLTERLRRRARSTVGNLDRLLDMAAGCLSSAAAQLGHRNDDGQAAGVGTALARLRDHIGRDYGDWCGRRDRRYRSLAYGSKVRLGSYTDVFTGKAIVIDSTT